MNLVIKSSDTAEKVRPSYKAGADKTFLSSLRIINTLPVLFWGEKFALLIDYFQLFSLLWITAQPWGLPFIFSVYSRPLLYFNLDFFSLTSNGAVGILLLILHIQYSIFIILIINNHVCKYIC